MIRLTHQEILGLITAGVLVVLIGAYMFALPAANALAAGFQLLTIACEDAAAALMLPGAAGWFVLWSLVGIVLAAGVMLAPARALPDDAGAVREQLGTRLSRLGLAAVAALAFWVFIAVLTA